MFGKIKRLKYSNGLGHEECEDGTKNMTILTFFVSLYSL